MSDDVRGKRIHEQDVMGMLLGQQDWKHLNIPLDEGSSVDLTLQNFNGIPVWTTNSLLDEKSREEIRKKIAESEYFSNHIVLDEPAARFYHVTLIDSDMDKIRTIIAGEIEKALVARGSKREIDE